MRSRFVVIVIGAGLAVTACSSSGGGSPTPAPTTSSSTTSAITTPPPTTSTSAASSSSAVSGSAPSHDALTAIVAQQSDLPAGYTSAPPDSSSDDQANQAKVVSCVGSTSVNPADRIEEVHSNDFSQDPQTVSSDVTSFKSQAAVDALVSVLQDPKAGNCFDAIVREQVASSGGTVTAANVTLTPGNNGGPSNVVALLQATVSITVQGQKATVNVVEGFIQGRQLLASVSVQSINADVDVNVFKQVGAAVANRAAAA